MVANGWLRRLDRRHAHVRPVLLPTSPLDTDEREWERTGALPASGVWPPVADVTRDPLQGLLRRMPSDAPIRNAGGGWEQIRVGVHAPAACRPLAHHPQRAPALRHSGVALTRWSGSSQSSPKGIPGFRRAPAGMTSPDFPLRCSTAVSRQGSPGLWMTRYEPSALDFRTKGKRVPQFRLLSRRDRQLSHSSVHIFRRVGRLRALTEAVGPPFFGVLVQTELRWREPPSGWVTSQWGSNGKGLDSVRIVLYRSGRKCCTV